MNLHVHESELAVDDCSRHIGILVGEKQGALKGFCAGISYYDNHEFGVPGVHDDQEGFYILAGPGTAKIGSVEFPIRPGSSFLAAKGVPHTMKRDRGSVSIKVLWFHGAV